MSKIKAGRVMARCLECGGEAITRSDGVPPTITHDVGCPERTPMIGEARLVRSGVAQGARVVYRPRRESDRFPWMVESNWHPNETGWRYGTPEVCTVIEYQRYAKAKP